ncbi:MULTISPECIES: LysR family transcriptional regulator [Pseudomonas]|jgi:DNA-binding transcriptional LysR family regulator|uniref:LysR family transcriptional regulator n=1 Tax=Pseudomonas TaxID=286 RepID=UPI001C6417C1|nr:MULTISPECIES: LysR family transcriptional regulator [Pseudomonas]WDG57229.1 LysR family transcriptional regulator [Pseudomonas chlororaphis]WDH00982.1 LysR family transcriptional regulator [Pseudomonas chlororaphis]WDH19626.1 LysR family transcriptional regulator [Pseudomonas chlororaphis]WDH26008.1 LysR family transcriptional regulator [Pseudomonas chlororaphis]WDH38324.1 LysR family transcriptional regulator [Pseudomonas chlororaphis]
MEANVLGSLSDIDLRMLRVFCTIVDAGGFTAAQARLNTSLSRLSVVVRDLEERLGCSLCRRGSSGFQLTEEGLELFDAAQLLFRDIERFRQQANQLGGPARDHLQIGNVDSMLSLSYAPLPLAINLFRQRLPEVRLGLHILRPDELEQAVLDERLHLAIGAFHHQLSGLRYQPLFEEEQNLYCAAGHPLFQRSDTDLTLEEICNTPYVGRGYMAENQRPHGLYFLQSATVYTMEAIATLVFSDSYLGYLPSHYAANWVARGQMRALLPQRLAYRSTFHCITRQGQEPKAALTCFLQALEQAQQQLAQGR